MKPLLVLRPEPGNRATVDRALDIGLDPLSCPLFAVEPVAWTAPNPARFDHVLFTSANALRHGGDQLARLTMLPALAVGPATAEAACASGFDVALTGDDGVEALLTALTAPKRLLHLASADQRRVATRHTVETMIIYRSVAVATATVPAGQLVALVHSPRAGARLADLAPDRSAVSIIAISAAAAAACGHGWRAIKIADRRCDGALLALAARLCQD